MVNKEPCKCPKILIADDEPFNLIALEGLLHQFNVGSVDKAYHGKEALQKIEFNLTQGSNSCGQFHRPYKLIMLDKNMPVLDGVDAALIFKRWVKEGRITHRVKLALVTGDETIIEKEYDKSLFDFVLIKPIAQNNVCTILIKSRLLDSAYMNRGELSQIASKMSVQT